MSKVVKQLAAIDAAFLYQETAEVPMHAGNMAVFKLPKGSRPDFYETFKKTVGERMHLAPFLKWKLESDPLGLSDPNWVEDEEFDLDRHIFRTALPEPRTRATAERVIARMHAKPLNRARPMWEFYVCDGMENDEAVIYAKYHHALTDGGASALLMQIIYDAAAAPAAAEPADVQPVQAPAPPADLGTALYEPYIRLWEQQLKLTARWPEVLKALPPLVERFADPSALRDWLNSATPRTPLNRAISSERSFAGVTLSLRRAKALAAKAGGKLNDVVMAVCSGMLRRYLAETGDLPAQSLTAMIPISTREQGDAEANNQVMAMVCSLATTVEDPKERLTTIIAESSKAKEMINPFKALASVYRSNSALGAPIAVQVSAILYSRSSLADVVAPSANVVISNVAGPRTPMFAAGAQMVHIFPVSIPAHGTALNITVLSYLDHMDFGLIAGANVVPDVRRLADMLPEEFAKLEAAYGIGKTRVARGVA